MIMLGFILMWPTILTVAMFPILVIMYVRLARTEEKAVCAEFGDTYQNYVSAAPRFIPMFKFGSRRTDGSTRTGNAPSGSAMRRAVREITFTNFHPSLQNAESSSQDSASAALGGR
jgi:hypothetical protein